MTVAVEEWLKRIPRFTLAGDAAWSEGTVRGPRQLADQVLVVDASQPLAGATGRSLHVDRCRRGGRAAFHGAAFLLPNVPGPRR
jgi:hypothetical protein